MVIYIYVCKVHTRERLREEYSTSRGLKKSGRIRLVRNLRRLVSISSGSSAEGIFTDGNKGWQ